MDRSKQREALVAARSSAELARSAVGCVHGAKERRGPASGHREGSRAVRGFAARFERPHVREPWIAASSAKRWLRREAPRIQREALAQCVHGAKERSQLEALVEC